MGWPITDWTGNPDWAALSNINAFIGAVRERQLCVGGAAWNFNEAGDDVQAATWFQDIQDFVDGAYDLFAVSHDAGVARGAGYYSGKATIDFYADLAAVFSAAGKTHANWRRYTTHPSDGGSVLYGRMEIGDIIGPWLFEDLQATLNVLVWTSSGYSWISGGTNNRNQASEPGATWAAAKTAAEAEWAASGGEAQEDAAPLAYTAGVGTYGANAYRRRAKGYTASIWTGCKRDVDFYVNAHGLDAFDDHQDGVLEELEYCYDTQAATTAANVTSNWLGADPTGTFADSKLAWCAEPPPDNDLGWAVQFGGYDRWDALVRWNVTDGFEYQ